MNPFEDLLITMGITAVRAAVKNPAHAAKLQHQLVSVANDIYITYGFTPPPEALAVIEADHQASQPK